MSIQTYVFIDLETTGIPASRAKVTEIALISVSRNDIEEADSKNLPPINKLSFLCNPQKDIQPAAAKITGIKNKVLKNQPIFKDIIKCINSFLDKPKPVCLIAHNGNRFDFKILQAEYKSANESLPHDLECVDSLNVFRNILKAPKRDSTNALHNNSTSSLDKTDKNEEDWIDLSVEEIQEIDELIGKFSQLSTTPKVKKNKKEIKSQTQIGENSQTEIKGPTPKGGKLPKKIKCLTPKEEIPPNEIKSQTPKGETPPKVSHTLSSLYERLVNKKVTNRHQAEADCIMLLECVVATKKDFLDYVDNTKKLVSQINP